MGKVILVYLYHRLLVHSTCALQKLKSLPGITSHHITSLITVSYSNLAGLKEPKLDNLQ
jgi:hypothetical protein